MTRQTTDDILLANANTVLGLTAVKLAEDGVIADPTVITENYYVTIVKPNVFLAAFYRIKGFIFDDEGTQFFAVMPINKSTNKGQE